MVLASVVTLSLKLTLAVGARWSYEDAYINGPGAGEMGQWYAGQDNEDATLAWGESYVMMSLAAMFRATGHRMYLDRLAFHIDAVLAARDDNRGVADYRGVSTACWRNISYQPEPYCYVVHSGMLAYPMAEFVRLAEDRSWADEPTYDGTSYADKAAAYLEAARATVAAHDDQYDAGGYYVFRPDASFLATAGQVVPLNMSNAMGRVLLVLADITGEAQYADKAQAIAQRLRDQMTIAGDGAYLWNYAGGPYAGNGEDVSHAAINVDFAVMAADAGVVFDAADVAGLAATFVQRVYVDDATIADRVGGGSTNDPGYRPQVGRWLRLTAARTAVYTAVRDLYEQDYPPPSIGSGALLLGWALLAEHEPRHCAPFFYSVDWDDLGDARQATAHGANVLTVPPDLAAPCIVPLQVDVPRATEVQQWDGDAYHRVASWRPTVGMAPRHVPYEPAWPFPYWKDGVLFQFDDAFVAGDGIVVAEHPGLQPPAIVSQPPTEGEPNAAWSYVPSGQGDGAWWWSLTDGPPSATIDPADGAMAWTPETPGVYDFELRLSTDVGEAVQTFAVEVDDAAATGGDPDESGGGDAGSGEGTTGAGSADGPGPSGDDAATGGDAGHDTDDAARGDGDSGCACVASRRPAWRTAWLPCLVAVVARPRRRRR